MSVSCDRHEAVREAAATGRWTEALRNHAERCSSCREVAIVTRALAGSDAVRMSPADPARLWAHGRVVRRLRAEAQVSRVSLIVNTVIGLLCVGVLGYAGIRLGLLESASSRLHIAMPLGALLLGLGAVVWLSRLATRSPSHR